MNAEQYDKFTKTLASGYKQLITHRPQKPLQHFIFNLLSKVPEVMREKDQLIADFYKKYQQNDLKKVQNLDSTQS